MNITDLKTTDDGCLMCPNCGEPLRMDVRAATIAMAYLDADGDFDFGDADFSVGMADIGVVSLMCPECGWVREEEG